MGIVRNRLKSMIAEALKSVIEDQDKKPQVSIELDIPKNSGARGLRHEYRARVDQASQAQPQADRL